MSARMTVLNHPVSWIVAALAWCSFSLIGLQAARRKGRPPAEGFALGFVLGPIGAVLTALLSIREPSETLGRVSPRASTPTAEPSTGEMLVIASRFNVAFLIVGLVVTLGVVVLGLYFMSQSSPR